MDTKTRVAVRITKSKPGLWYENLIGRSFVVTNYNNTHYSIVGDIHALLKEDCEICKEVRYIAHPIAGDVYENISKVLQIVRDIYINEPGVIPFVPYLSGLLCGQEDTPNGREIGLQEDEYYIRSGVATSIGLYGDKISSGMKRECYAAFDINMQVFAKTRETKEDFKRIFIEQIKTENND